MDVKMIIGLVAGGIGFLGAVAAVLVVLLGHPQASRVSPYPTPRHTPGLSIQIRAHTGATSCRRHC
jgi:hypothetical protein